MPHVEGYLLLVGGGGVSNFGVPWDGSLNGKLPTGVHAVGIAADSATGTTTGGYWVLTSNGGVTNFDAPWDGSPKAEGGAYANTAANPVVGIAAGANGTGYDVLRENGGVDSYGTGWHGSLAAKLPKGVRAVAIASDRATGGYWVLTSNGGVTNFDAPWDGSPKAEGGAYANTAANPVVGIAAGANGTGYDVLRENGGVDSYGTPWRGSAAGRLGPGVHAVGLATDPATGGYWITTNVGNAYNEDAPFLGSLAGTRLATPVVAIAAETADVAPTSIATTALPSATLGMPYDAQLVVEGGVTPYTWSITSGSLPAGLSLAPNGLISGTPTSPAAASFTVEVRDSASSASASLTLLVYLPSRNWSGWAVANPNGGLTGAAGTFTVPSLYTNTAAGSMMAEWVGVDGFGKSSSGVEDTSLIQAGIGEAPDPSDPGYYTIQAWWEILPAASTPIPNFTVSPGDSVTVQISEVSSGEWTITLTDNTTGQSFSTTQSYSGPGESAEWIVEAPEECNSSGTCPVVPLAHYTSTVFSNLRLSGATPTGIAGIALVQNGVQVSTPSPLATLTTGTGFRVSYGAATPPAP